MLDSHTPEFGGAMIVIKLARGPAYAVIRPHKLPGITSMSAENDTFMFQVLTLTDVNHGEIDVFFRSIVQTKLLVTSPPQKFHDRIARKLVSIGFLLSSGEFRLFYYLLVSFFFLLLLLLGLFFFVVLGIFWHFFLPNE